MTTDTKKKNFLKLHICSSLSPFDFHLFIVCFQLSDNFINDNRNGDTIHRIPTQISVFYSIISPNTSSLLLPRCPASCQASSTRWTVYLSYTTLTNDNLRGKAKLFLLSVQSIFSFESVLVIYVLYFHIANIAHWKFNIKHMKHLRVLMIFFYSLLK